MNNMQKIGVVSLSFTGAVMLFTQSVSAHGFGEGMGFGHDKLMDKEVRQEMKEQMRVKRDELKTLTREERMQKLEEMWQERQTWREEREKAWSEFTGLTREQMEEKRKAGQTMGQILQGQGKTVEQTQTFLETQGNKKVDSMATKWSLSQETVTQMKNNVVEWAKKLVAKWFGN